MHGRGFLSCSLATSCHFKQQGVSSLPNISLDFHLKCLELTQQGHSERRYTETDTLHEFSQNLKKTTSASWLVDLRWHVVDEYGLVVSPSLLCPTYRFPSYGCHRK
ncbi:hypothetical protein ATANTOWER_032156 [Ataeniobius toweri]|uniref:Uncharacterized protein n=1 Tax=Ataeniobius toweri TaxID=208326 RepID=A0ABU7BXC2_9TELE|nr:hypothetical protein [Ataeniobius toweri]